MPEEVKEAAVPSKLWVLLVVRPDGDAKAFVRRNEKQVKSLISQLKPMMVPAGIEFQFGEVDTQHVEFLVTSGALYFEPGVDQSDLIFNVKADQIKALLTVH